MNNIFDHDYFSLKKKDEKETITTKQNNQQTRKQTT
jgi:hypothetical protein